MTATAEERIQKLREKIDQIGETKPWMLDKQTPAQVRQEIGAEKKTHPIHTTYPSSIPLKATASHISALSETFPELRKKPVLRREKSNDYAYKYDYGIFDELLDKDAQVIAGMNILAGATLKHDIALNLDPKYRNESRAREIMELCEMTLDKLGFTNYGQGFSSMAYYTYIYGHGYGFGFNERLWEAVDGAIKPNIRYYMIKDLEPRHPRHFVMVGNYPYFMSAKYPEGEPIDPLRVAMYRPCMNFSNPYGDPLLAKVWWYSAFKGMNVREIQLFLEKYGSPYLILRSSDPLIELNADEKEVAIRVLSRARRGAGLLLPSRYALDVLPFHPPETINSFDTWNRYLDEQISKILLGTPHLLSMEGGNRSSLDVSLDILNSIVLQHGNAFKSWIQRDIINATVDMNYPEGQRFYPQVEMRGMDNKDADQRQADFNNAAVLGVETSKKQYRSIFGVKEPDGEEDAIRPWEMLDQLQATAGSIRSRMGPQVGEVKKTTKPPGSNRGENEDTKTNIS